MLLYSYKSLNPSSIALFQAHGPSLVYILYNAASARVFSGSSEDDCHCVQAIVYITVKKMTSVLINKNSIITISDD